MDKSLVVYNEYAFDLLACDDRMRYIRWLCCAAHLFGHGEPITQDSHDATIRLAGRQDFETFRLYSMGDNTDVYGLTLTDNRKFHFIIIGRRHEHEQKKMV